MRALVLVNPAASRANGHTRILEALHQTPLSVIAAGEKNPENFPTILRRFQDSIDCVIVGGGDGTVNTILPTALETGVPIAVLPLGTANNLARTLGISYDLQENCNAIANGVQTKVDIGFANGIPFLNVAGIGLSTYINKYVPSKLKRRWGPLAYGIAGMKIARRTHPFSAEIRHEGQRLHVKSLQITICNGRYYGAGMTIDEHATITDGLLHLCSTEVETWFEGLKLLPRMWKGRYGTVCGVRLLHAPRIEIHTRRPMSVDTDGEVLTRTPLTLEVKARALSMIVPRAADSNNLDATSTVSVV